MIRLVINGAQGQMGQRLCAVSEAADDIDLVARIGRNNAANAGLNPAADIDLVIDFSSDDGALQAVDLSKKYGAALLVGTTGLSAQTSTTIRSCAQHSPIMIAPNTSRGVALLTHVLQQVAKVLGGASDVDIIESHHAGKRDRPSGTALRLADALRASGAAISDDRIHSIRAGKIIGKHCVYFSGIGEILEFSHTAISRDLFASGALDAGRWLCQQPPGDYDIAEACGLSASVCE